MKSIVKTFIEDNKVEDVKWTNRYDCPKGYEYNEDGYVITRVPYLKISVSILPHLFAKYSIEELFLYNLLALKLLNPKYRIEMLAVILNRRIYVLFNRLVGIKIIENSLDKLYNEVTTKEDGSVEVESLAKFIIRAPEEIFRFDTVWYGKECKLSGRRAIARELKFKAISIIREGMEVNRKYKTSEVMYDTDSNRYEVLSYWKHIDLDKPQRRSLLAIAEGILLLHDRGIEHPTQKMIAEVSGVSTRTIRNLIGNKRNLIKMYNNGIRIEGWKKDKGR